MFKLNSILNPINHGSRGGWCSLPLQSSGRFAHTHVRSQHQGTHGNLAANSEERPGKNHCPDVPVTCVGFSSRGIDALRQLSEGGGLPSATTDLWCIDSDATLLDSAKEFSKIIHLDAMGANSTMRLGDVSAIIGNSASDASGKGNIGSGDGSLAFVLAPSSMAGGTEPLLQLTNSFRAAGHFTVAAIVSPFEFEGSLKKKQAKQLIADLASLAHLVVVLDQDVLLQQSYGEETLTVAESTEIANTALEQTVRCIVQAVHAPEMLKSTQGGLMWHGKELRHFKRLISPPLQQLLTQKGNGVLGRGLACLPADAAKSMGHESAMMHLASEAIAGAAESPFVEGVLAKAGGVLCCLRVPKSSAPVDQESGKAYRMAAQAGAGALRTITGRSCDDFLVYVETFDDESGSEGLRMEATMLVLWSQENLLNDDVRASWKSSWTLNDVIKTPSTSNGGRNDGPRTRTEKRDGPTGKNDPSWGMLSAMAGGEKGPKADKKINENAGQAYFSSQVKKPVVVKPTPEEKARTRSRQARDDNISVGDVLAESLTAQSLDLPPAAARWRQERRSGQLRQRRLVVWEVDEEEPWESSESNSSNPFKAILGGSSQRKKKVNVRDRVAGVLAQDRDEAWEAGVVADHQDDDEIR
jgi:hypothetical protein